VLCRVGSPVARPPLFTNSNHPHPPNSNHRLHPPTHSPWVSPTSTCASTWQLPPSWPPSASSTLAPTCPTCPATTMRCVGGGEVGYVLGMCAGVVCWGWLSQLQAPRYTSPKMLTHSLRTPTHPPPHTPPHTPTNPTNPQVMGWQKSHSYEGPPILSFLQCYMFGYHFEHHRCVLWCGGVPGWSGLVWSGLGVFVGCWWGWVVDDEDHQ